MPNYAAGTSGTVTIPVGALLVQTYAVSPFEPETPATMQIFAGDIIPVREESYGLKLAFDYQPDMVASEGTNTVVFSNTSMYFVQWAI